MEEADVYTPTQSNVYGYVASVAGFSFQITKGAENLVNYINPPLVIKFHLLYLTESSWRLKTAAFTKPCQTVSTE